MNSKRDFLFLLLTIILLVHVLPVSAYEIDKTATVTEVIDGDTFKISGDRVRLADIDAPEDGEDGYIQAKNALKNLVAGKKVYLDTDQKSGRDIYDRLVAVVYLKHNSTHYKNVNYALLQQGVVILDDYTNNEFNPYSWTLFVRYATTPPPSPPEPEPPPEPAPEPDPEPEPPPPPPAPKKEYTLKIQILGSGTTNPVPATYVHTEGTLIQVNNEPSEGWQLIHWILDGQTIDQSEQVTITMDGYHDLTVVFSEKPPSSKIYFKIYGADQSPIKEVTVEATQKPENQPDLTIISDERGEAQTGLIRLGRYEFKFTKKGYETQSTQITLDYDEHSSQTVFMEIASVDIVIQLRDHEGKTVSHTMISSVSTPAGQEPVTGVTDEDGTFILYDVYPGNYSFTATGYKIHAKTFELSAPLGEEASFNFTWYTQSVCNLMVRVEDEKGYLVDDVLIE